MVVNSRYTFWPQYRFCGGGLNFNISRGHFSASLDFIFVNWSYFACEFCRMLANSPNVMLVIFCVAVEIVFPLVGPNFMFPLSKYGCFRNTIGS